MLTTHLSKMLFCYHFFIGSHFLQFYIIIMGIEQGCTIFFDSRAVSKKLGPWGHTLKNKKKLKIIFVHDILVNYIDKSPPRAVLHPPLV